MEWIGLVCLGILLCHSAYPGKVNKLEKKIKKLESIGKKEREESEMSKLIADLVGKYCKIRIEDDSFLSDNVEMIYEVVDIDEEWMKVAYEDKKKGKFVKLIRIDSIQSVEEVQK